MNSQLLQSVITDLEQREARGKEKYNTTMDRADLSHEEWLQHAYEEALDMALYLKKAKQQITREREWTGWCDRSDFRLFEGDTIRLWFEDSVEPNGGVYQEYIIKWHNNKFRIFSDLEEYKNRFSLNQDEIMPLEEFMEDIYKMTKVCFPNSMSDKSNINPNSAQ